MPANNSKIWSAQELSTFLTIIDNSVIQSELDGSVRNEKVYKDISQGMAAEGFQQTSVQCRAKLKKLKGQYKKIKDANSHSGNSQSTWRWYNAMDAIYGHRPANQGREGGLDSVSALLESIIEPVNTVKGLSNDTSTFSDDGPSTSFSSACTMASTPTQPQIAPKAPRHQHTGDRRWLLDVRTVMEEMRAADERQQERIESLSEWQFQALRPMPTKRGTRKQKSPVSRWSSWLPSSRPSLVSLGSLFKCWDPMPPTRL
ncbi:Hypothetical predicted protein [Pelobates cultripes]|uniref:Myb/SANT-like DNA-binding domain-containing protein n=1 Tax=Pelobates cultripes TaxID=61616 RepID=A0AAD1R9J1_PELCU|nr:Hypothetical predicted protein [Pelobates cultripes]